MRVLYNQIKKTVHLFQHSTCILSINSIPNRRNKVKLKYYSDKSLSNPKKIRNLAHRNCLIMHYFFRYTLFLFAVLLVACNSSAPQQSEARQKDEAKAKDVLLNARTAFQQKHYDDARKQLRSLRRNCPLALNARESGILLMDSIEISATSDRIREIDSLVQIETQQKGKVSAPTQAQFEELCQQAKFYHRKLQHDLEHRKQHD